MNATNVISILAIGVSIIALSASTRIGMNQSRFSRRASYSTLLDAMSELRSVKFHDDQEYLCSTLPLKTKPYSGIGGLPKEARRAIYNVAYFYEQIAAMVKLGLLNQSAAMYILHHRITRLWKAIEPYVVKERSISGETHLLALLEEFNSIAVSFSVDSYTGIWRVTQAPHQVQHESTAAVPKPDHLR